MPLRAPAGRRSAEEVFWRAEPSRNAAYSAAPSTIFPLAGSCDKPRLSTDSAATGCPSPRRTSERLKHSHDATFRRTEALLAHFSRRWAGFHSRKSHGRPLSGRSPRDEAAQTCPPAEPPQVTAVAARNSQAVEASRRRARRASAASQGHLWPRVRQPRGGGLASPIPSIGRAGRHGVLRLGGHVQGLLRLGPSIGRVSILCKSD